MYRSFLKRFFDFCIAVVVFTLAFPIFAVITILLFFVNKGKPFFFQKRPGRAERIFTVIKFKTMTDERDAKGKLLPDNLLPRGTDRQIIGELMGGQNTQNTSGGRPPCLLK